MNAHKVPASNDRWHSICYTGTRERNQLYLCIKFSEYANKIIFWKAFFGLIIINFSSDIYLIIVYCWEYQIFKIHSPHNLFVSKRNNNFQERELQLLFRFFINSRTDGKIVLLATETVFIYNCSPETWNYTKVTCKRNE